MAPRNVRQMILVHDNNIIVDNGQLIYLIIAQFCINFALSRVYLMLC